MPVPNNRGGATHRVAKHKPVLFIAEEHVLSFRSPFFRKRFNKVRHGIDSECTICLDGFVPTRTDTCQTCGLVVHQSCIVKWLRRNVNCPVNCPRCRTPWSKTSIHPNVFTFDQLDPEGFEVYIQWLYLYEISDHAADTADGHCVRLIKAYLVGDILSDSEFLLVVRNEIVETAVENGLSYSAIAFTYNNTHEPCALRRFLVDLYTLTGSMEQLKGGHVSHLFLVDMAQSFMVKSKEAVGKEYIRAQLAGEGRFENLGEN
ncbi:hypothetical protein E8E13_008124 [Curvularia kusanoi]|uniref:RING-type domain-containing protein n=1 Tax=Curvularia kusanoi TaxID=90978 RepID=A0A9P4TI20_CURKU|nr:hypothetical protein E8E13_008124 [Curvularia kusanoi]